MFRRKRKTRLQVEDEALEDFIAEMFRGHPRKPISLIIELAIYDLIRCLRRDKRA
jgi:hypothetical protein